MKNKKTIAASILLTFFATSLGLSSCNHQTPTSSTSTCTSNPSLTTSANSTTFKTSTSSVHIHNYSEWHYDENGHWKCCPEDGAITDKDEHKFVDGVCECGYKKPAPTIKYGSAETVIHLVKGETTITDYEDVVATIEDKNVVVTLDKTTGKLTITNLAAGRDYVLKIEKPDFITYEITICVDADENVILGGENGITLRHSRGAMTYQVGTEIAGNIVKLYDKDENYLDQKVVDEKGSFRFEDLSSQEDYYLTLTAFGIESKKVKAVVNSEGEAFVDFSKANSYIDGIIPGEKVIMNNLANYRKVGYENVNVEGDFYLATKIKADVTRLEGTNQARFGFSTSFGDKEYAFTFLYNENGTGKWLMQQTDVWDTVNFDSNLADAMAHDGLYMVLYREAKTGIVYLYFGTSVDNIQLEDRNEHWVKDTETVKEAITSWSVASWGGDYDVEFSAVRSGSSLGEVLGVDKNINITNEAVENGSIVVEGSKVYDDIILNIQPETDCELISILVNGEEKIGQVVDGKIVLKNYKEENLTIVPQFKKTIYKNIGVNATVKKYGVGNFALADGIKVKLENELLGTFEASVAEGKIVISRIPVGIYKVEVDGYITGNIEIVEDSDAQADIYVIDNLILNNDMVQTDWYNKDTAMDISKISEGIVKANGNTIAFNSNDEFDDLVYTVTTKNGNSTNKEFFYIFFEDGSYLPVSVCSGGGLRIENLADGNLGWTEGIYKNNLGKGTGWALISADNSDKYNRDKINATIGDKLNTGYDITLARHENVIALYVDGKFVRNYVLDSKYSTMKCHYGMLVWDSVGGNSEWKFAYSTDASTYFTKVNIATENEGEGTLTLDKENYIVGDRVYVTPAANEGNGLKQLLVNGVDVTDFIQDGKYSFVLMNNLDVNVKAVYEKVTSSAISAVVKGHKYKVEGNSIADGSKVIFDGGALGTFEFEVKEEMIEGKLPFGEYSVYVEGYLAQKVSVTSEGLSLDSIKLEYDLLYNVASTWNWGDAIDFSGQNDGTIVKAKEAGVLYAATKEEYQDVAITVNVVVNGGGRQGAFIKFGSQYVAIQVEKNNESGKYKVTWLNDQFCDIATMLQGKWDDLNGYSYDQCTQETIDMINAGTFKVTLVRQGANILAFIDGKLVGTTLLNPDYGTQKCQPGLYAMSTSREATIARTFDIETDLSKYAYTETFDLKNLNQSETGVVKVNGSVEFATIRTFDVLDATASWVYPGSGNRYGLAVVFGDGKVLRYDTRFNDGGIYDVQRCGWGNVDNYGWKDNVATIDPETYKTTGVLFRIVRHENSFKLYLNGNLIEDITLDEKYKDCQIRLRFNTEGSSTINYTF